MKVPRQLPPRPALLKAQIEGAEYIGSPEHKIERYWDGLPQAYLDKTTGKAHRPNKQDTTICPLVTEKDREMATGWVREALAARQFRYTEGDGDFPKHIWYYCKTNDQYWFGFCVNTTAGTYKGWPISEDEKLETFG